MKNIRLEFSESGQRDLEEQARYVERKQNAVLVEAHSVHGEQAKYVSLTKTYQGRSVVMKVSKGNGDKERARRRRQIEKNMLKAS